jgi:hypothetical protein
MVVRVGLIRGRSPSSIVLSLGASLRRVFEIRLPALNESLSIDILASSYLPYEASRTYREIVTEFNCRRTQYLVDTQRNSLRGL